MKPILFLSTLSLATLVEICGFDTNALNISIAKALISYWSDRFISQAFGLYLGVK